MQKLPPALAEAEMVLARDIFRDDNAGGPPICGKGISLTDPLIERLKRMGVQTIVVEGHPVRMTGDKNPEDILEDLDFRFRKAENDPLTGKLKKVYRQYLTKAFDLGE